MVQLREKNVPNGRQNLKLTRNDLVSVSISIFRRCYDALCGDTVVSVLRQHFSDVRAFCAISLFTFFLAGLTIGSYMGVRTIMLWGKPKSNGFASSMRWICSVESEISSAWIF